MPVTNSLVASLDKLQQVVSTSDIIKLLKVDDSSTGLAIDSH